MMRAFSAFALMGALAALSGCASNDRFYTADNYATQGLVSEKPFDQIVAECRYNTLTRNVLMDTYSLEEPRFKACMQAQGYQYQGD